MNKIQKTKQHIIDNKAIYITGGICLVVGAAGGGLYMATRPEIQQVVQNKALVNYKPVNNVIQITIPRAGNAGKVFIDKATGEYFMSENKLAEALGVSRSTVRKYVSGELPDLLGRQFEMVMDGVGEIVVNQTLAPAAA